MDAEEWADFFYEDVEPRLVEFAKSIARRPDVPEDIKKKFAELLCDICCKGFGCSGATHDCATECPVGAALDMLGFWEGDNRCPTS